MELDLQYWLEETDAQGDPSEYCKSDLEMWVLGIFNTHKFHGAGFSRSQKRRSFNEVWDAAKGNSLAIAFGFNEAIRRHSLSIGYVVSCARNMATTPPKKAIQPIEVVKTQQKEPTIGHDVVRIPRPAKPDPPAPKAKRAVKKATEQEKDVEWS